MHFYLIQGRRFDISRESGEMELGIIMSTSEILDIWFRISLLYSVRGRLHVYESVYDSAYDFMQDLTTNGLGF